ncbi:MAG: sulfatase family protein [Candidatus Cyclobacteriaceae bacterium M3_2C_046]
MKKTLIVLWLTIVASAHLLAQNRPNFIIILTDDQRWDAMGYAGNQIIQTPHMDALAEQGLYFKNAFVTTPICAASRASIMTGLYERTHQFTFDTPPLQQRWVDISYPQLLKEAGYRTGLFGKFGMQFADRADTAVFDQFFNTGTGGYFRLQGAGWKDHVHLTDLTTDKAIEFIQNNPADQPFCLSISYNAAHADDAHPQQYFWPERYNSLYQDLEIPLGELHQEKYFTSLPDFLQDSLYMGVIRYQWRYNTPAKYQQMVKGYYRLITTIDDNLGRLRKFLAQQGLARNTVIIFLGDNGYFLGERGLAGKWLMYENSLRVPLIIYDPAMNSPQAPEQMALNIDIAPTILDYAGVAIPSIMQGKSLRSFTRGKVEPWRTEFLCEHLFDIPYIPKSEGIRTEDWKYFRYIDHPETEALYNLARDPLEKDNLINDPANQEKVQQFRYQLEQTTKELSYN